MSCEEEPTSPAQRIKADRASRDQVYESVSAGLSYAHHSQDVSDAIRDLAEPAVTEEHAKPVGRRRRKSQVEEDIEKILAEANASANTAKMVRRNSIEIRETAEETAQRLASLTKITQAT